MLLYTMLYIVLAYLMLFAALTNSVCLNNASFFFLFKYFLCQGYELSGEIALKNNHYYYYYLPASPSQKLQTPHSIAKWYSRLSLLILFRVCYCSTIYGEYHQYQRILYAYSATLGFDMASVPSCVNCVPIRAQGVVWPAPPGCAPHALYQLHPSLPNL